MALDVRLLAGGRALITGSPSILCSAHRQKHGLELRFCAVACAVRVYCRQFCQLHHFPLLLLTGKYITVHHSTILYIDSVTH